MSLAGLKRGLPRCVVGFAGFAECAFRTHHRFRPKRSPKELATPWYSDQTLPFDIPLAGANEYGAMCAAKIFGVEILNEGTGISIDDAVSEQQATFVARAVEPMAAVPSPYTGTLGSLN